MNRTITTTSTPRRRSLRHAALALCAVLVALVAASCTADALDGTDTGAPSGNTNPDDVLTFAVGPRPGFTEVATTRGTDTAAPATRAELTDDGTHWEQGDILWLDAAFYKDKQDLATLDTVYFSALKYDVNEWRYLTVTEAETLNAGSIPRFSRLVRWPRGWKDWVDPGMEIYAYYAGSGKPDADGKLTIIPTGEIPTTPFIGGRTGGICSPDLKSVSLQLSHFASSRVRIPAGFKVELTEARYWLQVEFSPKGISPFNNRITEIPAQSEATDVFLYLDYPGSNPTAKLTRDNVSYTFTFPEITNAEGYITRDDASYTLTPYTSGTETPVADYDLTIADEAGLRAFAQAVNAGDRLPNGKPAAEARVLQTENIELTQGEWVPIGTGPDEPFRGAYNGNGNEISGLNITTAPQPTVAQSGVITSYAGLFGYAEGAVLTGIRLRGVGINIPAGGNGRAESVGSIAGWLENSTLSLCSADGTVNTDSGAENVYAGGIAGFSWYSTISRCRADVEIKATTLGVIYAGGIAGWNNSCNFILSCESGDRAVTAEGSSEVYAGGIAGENKGLIAFCRTGANTVTARNDNISNRAGGLVGSNVGSLYSCYSRATAEATGIAKNRAGAIVGNTSITVSYCYATGATDKGTSNLAADPNRNIFYDTDPKDGEIFRVMTGFTDKVESITYNGKTYYPFTTTYDPTATPAYGIIPQRAVWKNDGPWNEGDGTYPGLNIEEYEGK